jgi:hypothetical protein
LDLISAVTICKSLARRDEPLSCAGAGPLLKLAYKEPAGTTVEGHCADTLDFLQYQVTFLQGKAKFRAQCPRLLRESKTFGPMIASAGAPVEPICDILAAWRDVPQSAQKLQALLSKPDQKELSKTLSAAAYQMTGRFTLNTIPKDDPERGRAMLFIYHANKASGDAAACEGNSLCAAFWSGDVKYCENLEREMRRNACSRYLKTAVVDPKLNEAVAKHEKEKARLEQILRKQEETLALKKKLASQQQDLASSNGRLMMVKQVAELRGILDEAMKRVDGIEPKSMTGVFARHTHLLKLQQRLHSVQNAIEDSAKPRKNTRPPAKAAGRP